MTKKEMKGLLKNEKQLIIVAGVSHIQTPYRYFPQFVISDPQKILTDEKEVYKFLESSGIKPFAWGIMGNYDGWANLAIGFYNQKNVKDWNVYILNAYKPEEQDPDYISAS